jgi:anti-sigma regulatory factor (Ser/Thr protein kinase)
MEVTNLQPRFQDTYDFSDDITIKNHPEELVKVSDWLAILGQSLSLSDRLVFGLELILSEAVINIIENAYNDNLEHEIWIYFRQNKKLIELEVVDGGQPFDPLQYPQVELPNSLEEAQVGGLGIHLIRNYTDNCFYSRESNQNHLIMSINLDDTPPK